MTTTNLLQLDLPFVSTMGEEYQVDSHGVWREITKDHWLARTEIAVNVLPYKANFEMMRTRQLTTMGDTIMTVQGITDGWMYRYWTEGLIMTMPDDQHGRLRKILAPAFTPRAVERYRVAMREAAQRLVDRWKDEGRCDFVRDFSHIYPVEVMAQLFGLPTEDIDTYASWAVDIGLLFSFPVQPFRERVEAAVSGLFEYAGELIASRRKNLRDDLLSTLIQIEEGGDRLTTEEVQWQVVNMTFAGHDTTKNSMTYLVRQFCEHPDQWRLLRGDLSLVNNAIDEALRMEPVIPTTMRTVVDDYAYDGVVFPAGTPVMLRADTSNRDPSVFFDPDRFDITRHNANQHMTFGGGVHYCLGANLAKAEMQEALPILATAMPEVHLDGEGVWRPRSSMLLGADSMPIAFATA